jgi:iron complex transport system substrate-binding protein
MISSAHRISAAVLALAACLTVIAWPARAEDPVKDSSRIVSIGGDVTEILYALNAAPKVVAVDTTSTYPAAALKEKRNVGYMRALSTEGVLSANPSVIIAAAGAGPPEVVAALKASTVPYVEVPDDPTPDGVAAKIRLVAEAIGAEAGAEALTKKVAGDFAALAAQRARIKKPVRALFVLAVQNGRAVVAGRGTSANAVFTLAGAKNAAAKINGFKPLADEAAIDLAPDVIVAMSNPMPGNEAHEMLKLPVFRGTPAAANNRLVEMDGNYLLNFGPRAGEAARDLMRALYPTLGPAAQVSGQ